MRARLAAVVITLACVGYLALSLDRVLALLSEGDFVNLALAFAIMAIVAISAYLIYRELAFGYFTSRMAREFEEPESDRNLDIPRTPDGRVTKEFADNHFAKVAAEFSTDSTLWQDWYRLAVAYDLARDRRRARDAMLTAIDLYNKR